MLARITCVLAAVSTGLFDVVIWLDTEPLRSSLSKGQTSAGSLALVAGMALLPVSSGLLAWMLRHRSPTLATLCLLNIVLFVAMFLAFETEIRPRGALALEFGMILYWINVYLVILAGRGRELWAGGQAIKRATTES